MRQVIAWCAAFAAALVVCSAVGFAQAAKADVTGKWMFSVETGAGTGTPTFTFKQEGEKLTGHYSGQLGESDLTGSVKDNAIAFKFSLEAQGMALDFNYAGTVEGKDSMKGTVSIVGLGDGTFTAKRQ